MLSTIPNALQTEFRFLTMLSIGRSLGQVFQFAVSSHLVATYLITIVSVTFKLFCMHDEICCPLPIIVNKQSIVAAY